MILQQLEKARVAYHKSCQREQAALDKEKQANENTEMSPEKKQKFTDAKGKATEEKEKVRRDGDTLHRLSTFKIPPLWHTKELNMLHSYKVLLACCMWTYQLQTQLQALISTPSVSLVWRCVIVTLLSVYGAQHGNSRERPDDLCIWDRPPLKRHIRCSLWGSLSQLFHHKTCPCELPAAQRALWENPRGCDVLHASLHGGDGGHFWEVAGGGEEEDQFPEAGLPLHPQTSWRHQQWEVSIQGLVWVKCAWLSG